MLLRRLNNNGWIALMTCLMVIVIGDSLFIYRDGFNFPNGIILISAVFCGGYFFKYYQEENH